MHCMDGKLGFFNQLIDGLQPGNMHIPRGMAEELTGFSGTRSLNCTGPAFWNASGLVLGLMLSQ